MNPHDPIFVAPPITEVPDYVWSHRYDKPAFLPGRPVQKPKDTSRKSANTAMNIFAKAVVQRGRIPFEIRGDKAAAAEESEGLKAFRQLRALAESGSFPELTPDEINDEIREARKAR